MQPNILKGYSEKKFRARAAFLTSLRAIVCSSIQKERSQAFTDAQRAQHWKFLTRAVQRLSRLYKVSNEEILMAIEEKIARDVYESLERFGVPPEKFVQAYYQHAGRKVYTLDLNSESQGSLLRKIKDDQGLTSESWGESAGMLPSYLRNLLSDAHGLTVKNLYQLIVDGLDGEIYIVLNPSAKKPRNPRK